jgi:UDP-N-acetyl-D-mannosaminuronic acid dehydrogenase
MSFKTISIIGLGYIGLPTAVLFASYQIKVIGVDINQSLIEAINKGNTHMVEPKLDSLLKSVVASGHFRATIKPEVADAFLITVPTPFKKNHKPNLAFIKSAVKTIATVLKKGDLVILESTSPVNTTKKIVRWIAKIRPDLSFPQLGDNESDINVAYCPERVLPGDIIRELVENDRIIGGMSDECTNRAIELYKLFVTGNCFRTNSKTAEMIKLAENSFRDVNIAFANELSLISDKLDINVWELITLANYHPRVNILQPGPGVGGHCIAVDPWFIVNSTPKQAKLIHKARLVNDYKPFWVIDKVKRTVKIIKQKKGISNVKIACLGLSFKANIDDLRESPAINIVKSLADDNVAELWVVEPYINCLPALFLNKKNVCLKQLDQAIHHADIILILVNHNIFKEIDKNSLLNKKIIDTKGIFTPKIES